MVFITETIAIIFNACQYPKAYIQTKSHVESISTVPYFPFIVAHGQIAANFLQEKR